MAAISDLPKGQRIPQASLVIAQAGIQNEAGPDTPSTDHMAMAPFWRMANDLLKGQEAVIKGGELYLPRHPEENPSDYKYRNENGMLTNIYADIIETLSAKPFDDELTIIEGTAGVDFTGTPVKVNGKDSGRRTGGLIENIDGKGSHLHVFAQNVFYHGINAGIDWIFIDYPAKAVGLTAAQERKLNIRPYWYRIPAQMMLEVQSAVVGGIEEIIYARFFEYARIRTGFSTEVRERVREIVRPLIRNVGEQDSYGDPVWKLYEKRIDINNRVVWDVIDTGTYTIGEIPLVAFVCGRRVGSSWVIDPPMKSAASLNIELYQQETGLKHTNNLINYPMLAANGVNLKGADGKQVRIIIGPHTILSAPPDGQGNHGEWQFISPEATGLEFCAKRIEATKAELRELGRQPLTAQSASLTVIASAFASQKANSAIEAWAIQLKDALENALAITAKWLNLAEEPEVRINTDFPLSVDDKSADQIQTMREKGDISRPTYWSEMKRRNILSPDFDPKAEEEALKEELPSEEEILAAAGLGKPAKPPVKPVTK